MKQQDGVVAFGKVVTVDFELRDGQGELIQAANGEPIVYLHGSEDEIFPKLQTSLNGKQIGDEVFVELSPFEAFGEYDAELIRLESVSLFAEPLSVGMTLEEIPIADEHEPDIASDAHNTGFERVWTVAEIADGMVVLDGNHPLAGMALRYWLKVLDIRQASDAELGLGAATQSMFSVLGAIH